MARKDIVAPDGRLGLHSQIPSRIHHQRIRSLGRGTRVGKPSSPWFESVGPDPVAPDNSLCEWVEARVEQSADRSDINGEEACSPGPVQERIGFFMHKRKGRMGPCYGWTQDAAGNNLAQRA